VARPPLAAAALAVRRAGHRGRRRVACHGRARLPRRPAGAVGRAHRCGRGTPRGHRRHGRS